MTSWVEFSPKFNSWGFKQECPGWKILEKLISGGHLLGTKVLAYVRIHI